MSFLLLYSYIFLRRSRFFFKNILFCIARSEIIEIIIIELLISLIIIKKKKKLLFFTRWKIMLAFYACGNFIRVLRNILCEWKQEGDDWSLLYRAHKRVYTIRNLSATFRQFHAFFAFYFSFFFFCPQWISRRIIMSNRRGNCWLMLTRGVFFFKSTVEDVQLRAGV